MSAIQSAVVSVNDRYAAAASIASDRGAVELVAVHDPVGAAFSVAVQKLAHSQDLQPLPLWADLLPVSRYLRRLRALEPFPASFSARHRQAAADLKDYVTRGRVLVGSQARELLDQLADQSTRLLDDPLPPIGELLLESLAETGPEACVVLAANARADQGLRAWLAEVGVSPAVVAVAGRAGVRPDCRAYLPGPPGLLGSKSYLAPTCPELSYLFPSWAPDRSLPVTLLSEHAAGGIHPSARLAYAGTSSPEDTAAGSPGEPAPDTGSDDLDDQLLWSDPPPPRREPLPDEVLARRVLLAGGRSLLLDQDGGWIRALDPDQPPGERVYQRDEKTVAPGVYLVLREGVTSSQALYERTLSVLGSDAYAVESKQHEWKTELARMLRRLGSRQVIRQLERAGVHAASRAPAWVERTLARPQDRSDFERLLHWLDMSPARTYIANAEKFAKARYRAVSDIRELLEDALGTTDLERLRAEGIVRLGIRGERFANIMAARVIAISPDETLVSRASVRVPEVDRRAKWLE